MDVWVNTNRDLWTNVTKPKLILKEGDFVRLKVAKPTFGKGYSESFSEQLYKIKSVQETRPVTYRVCTSDGETVEGTFYKEELSKVT